jgi:hypothetical protein
MPSYGCTDCSPVAFFDSYASFVQHSNAAHLEPQYLSLTPTPTSPQWVEAAKSLAAQVGPANSKHLSVSTYQKIEG